MSPKWQWLWKVAEALKLFEKLPENERTVDKLKEILRTGIEKRYGEKRIILILKPTTN